MCRQCSILIFQSNGDGCSASYSGKVTATEDDYTGGTTSTKEYKPVATVKILGESCRAVDNSSNAPKVVQIKVYRSLQMFLSSWELQGCPISIGISPDSQTEELHQIIDAPGSASNLIVLMH